MKIEMPKVFLFSSFPFLSRLLNITIGKLWRFNLIFKPVFSTSFSRPIISNPKGQILMVPCISSHFILPSCTYNLSFSKSYAFINYEMGKRGPLDCHWLTITIHIQHSEGQRGSFIHGGLHRIKLTPMDQTTYKTELRKIQTMDGISSAECNFLLVSHCGITKMETEFRDWRYSHAKRLNLKLKLAQNSPPTIEEENRAYTKF